MPATGFAARYRGFVQAPAPGNYALTVTATGAATVWLDGVAIGPAVSGEGTLTLTGRPQRLRIDWQHADGPPRLSVAWKLASGATPPTLTPERP